MGVPLRKNVQFQLLWVGGAVSQLGTQLTTYAFPLLIFAVTGSYFWAGVVTGARAAALLLAQLPAGVWVDRWDRGRVLLFSQAAQAVALAVMAVNVVSGHNDVAVFVAMAAVEGAGTAFAGPARTTAIKAVVPAGQLPVAFAQEEARGHAARLAGPPLGALLYGLGRSVPFVADAVTYLVAAVCAAFARIPARTGQSPRQRMHEDMKEAWLWLWHQRGLRNVVGVFLVLNLLGGGAMLPTVALVKERGGSDALVGLVLAGMGIGGVLGSLVAPRVTVTPGRLLVAVTALFGLSDLAMTLPFGAWWPVVPLTVFALGTPLINVSVGALITALVPEHLMGRMDAVTTTAARVFTPVAPVLGAFAADAVGGAVALLVFGSLLLVTAVVAGLADLRTEPASAERDNAAQQDDRHPAG
ncbi:MFS transporter [Nocardia sp. NRRL S-836]|uniref:MFS transporter n=1 Tax=Nocardia sp. NRRL S-836 TaxID=1519492 RepID=UPI0006ADD1AE|nr:MFS transporter [Nocardia sp. NRRL S-836]KOV81650.1 hypothetical protein ADL03_27880 [Nocardia sp. NRRL S-836]